MKDSEKIQEVKSLLTELKHAWVPQDVESTNAHARKIEALEHVIRQAERVDGLIKVKKVLADKVHEERRTVIRYRQLLENVMDNGICSTIDLIARELYLTDMKGADPNDDQS